MKYLVIVVVSAFFGFVGAWLLFKAVTSPVVVPEPTRYSAPASSSAQPLQSSPDQGARQLTFDDISRQSNVFDIQYAAWQVAASADVPTLRALIERSLEQDDPLLRENVTSILLERYVQLDPPGAMAFVTNESRFDQDAMQGHVLTSWVRYDPGAAIDYFRNLTSPQTRTAIGVRLLEDPVVIASGLVGEVELAIGPNVEQIKEQLRLRRADPQSLFESALAMEGRERMNRLSYAITRWAREDPEAALIRAQALADATDREFAVQRALHEYAQRDPSGAWEYLQLNMPDNSRLQHQILTVMAQRDINEALPLVENLISQTGSTDLLTAIIGPWVQRDPVRAIRYIETLAADNKLRLYQTAAFSYVNANPEEGLEWVLGLGSEYNQVKQALVQNLNGSNVGVAERALATVSDGSTRSSLISGIALHKARSDPDEALRWLDAYRRDPAFATAYQSVISNIARRDPERAAGLVEAIVDSEAAAGAVTMIAQSWYRRDADRALTWLSSLPNSGSKHQAISSIAGSVAHGNVQAAITLIEDLPESFQQNARYNIAQVWSRNEPDRIDEIISTLELRPEFAETFRTSGTRAYRP